LVADGRLSPAEAGAKLRPWAAAAAFAGTDAAHLVHSADEWQPFTGRCLAEAIMPMAEWAPVIVEARDAVMARYAKDPASVDQEAARDLLTVCDGLYRRCVPGVWPHGVTPEWI